MSEEQNNKIYDETKVLYDGDNFMVIEPLTQKSASYFTNDNNDYVKLWTSKYRDVGNSYLIIDKRYTPTNFYGIHNDNGKINILYFDGEDFDVMKISDFNNSIPSEVRDSLNPFLYEGTTYGILNDIKNGKDFSLYDLRNSSDIINKIRFNQNRPGKSMVSIEFDDAESYFTTMGADEDSIWLIRYLLDNYNNNIEYDNYDNNYHDWIDGYLLSTFNEENNKLLNKILSYISPQLQSKSTQRGSEWDREVSVMLNDMFEREIDWIITDYTDEDNRCRTIQLRNDIKNDACDVLGDYGIFMGDCFRRYFTTVDVLLRLYKNTDDKSQSIGSLFGELIDGNNMDYSEWPYETYCEENFDEELNKQINQSLTSIIEKIEDSEKFIDIDKYSRLYDKYVGKYGLNKAHKSPISDNTFFRIVGINGENNKIVVGVAKDKPLDFQSREYDEQGFAMFLIQPELF